LVDRQFRAADHENVPRDPLGLSGQTLLDRYAVEAAFAQGGMAIIYRGRDTRLLRAVCIKVFMRLDPAQFGYRTAYEHFVQEAFALSQFNHPHTLRIYDFGYLEEGGPPFQISELLEGGTLGARIRSEGPLDPHAALDLLAPIAGALAEAHARGIVHRDIKPSNILFGLAGASRVVKLCDFGIAKANEEDFPNRAEDTIASAGPRLRLYSPGWSAPEQLRGHAIGPAADVFALGLVLAYVLTGHSIFKATRSDEAIAERLDAEARIDDFLAFTGVSSALAAVIRRACRDDVDARFASVDELIEALRGAVKEHDPDEIITDRLRPVPTPPVLAVLAPPPVAPAGTPLEAEAAAARPLLVDPQGDGEVLVGGRRLRIVAMTAGTGLDIGGDGPWLKSPARFRITITPSQSSTPRLNVKGLNCFVSRSGARPSTAVDVDSDTDVSLMSPDRRPLDGVRCTLGRAGEAGRLYDLGHVTLAVPAEARAVLLDLGPGRELALLHRRNHR
jgi:serine/threonine-protein kinase